MKIHIVTRSGCPFCDRSKTLLTELGKDFTYEVIDDAEERARFYEKCGEGVKTVPQIFIDGERIGGYTNLMQNLERITGKYKMEDTSVVYKPFRYPWAVDMAREHERTHWIEDEIALGQDVTDWTNGKLSKFEKDFVTNILKLFTMSDVQVASNYYNFIIPRFKNNEIRMMLGSFANIESVHMRAYSLLNETLGFPDSDWYAFLEYEQMRDKAEYMINNHTNNKQGVALTLAKNVFSEGVMLFASFAMLLNFARYGKMPGMCKIVELSIRDESRHVEGLSKLLTTFFEENKSVVNDETKKAIYDMARQTIELEDAFIDMTFALGQPEGITKQEIKDYVKYITNQRLLAIGMKPIMDVTKNPLPWVDWLVSGNKQYNFFEKLATYEVATMTGEWDYNG